MSLEPEGLRNNDGFSKLLLLFNLQLEVLQRSYCSKKISLSWVWYILDAIQQNYPIKMQIRRINLEFKFCVAACKASKFVFSWWRSLAPMYNTALHLSTHVAIFAWCFAMRYTPNKLFAETVRVSQNKTLRLFVPYKWYLTGDELKVGNTMESFTTDYTVII